MQYLKKSVRVVVIYIYIYIYETLSRCARVNFVVDAWKCVIGFRRKGSQTKGDNVVS